MTPEAYLKSKGFKLRQAPGEWQTQCPFCGDTNKHGHLYVNRDHGAWICHRCQEHGGFIELQTKLGDEPEPVFKDLASRWEVWQWLTNYAMGELLDSHEALSYLKDERGLTAESIAKYHLGYLSNDWLDDALEKWSMTELKDAGLIGDKNYPIFWNAILIPYQERNNVVALRAKNLDTGKILQTKDTSVRLFGSNNIRGHAEAYLCEGELDAIYLGQLGYPTAASPGAGLFQESWVSWFNDARRVFICFDADDAGYKGANRTASMIGRKSRILELPVPDKFESADITEFFLRDVHTKDEFDHLVDQIRGERIYSIVASLDERDEMLADSGIKLGLADLDRQLLPGLLPGQIMTILAKTGAGKTAFISQLLHNMSSWVSYDQSHSGSGVPALVLSLEQTKSELAERLERIGRLHYPQVTREEFGGWYSNIRICDENKIPPEDVHVLYDEFIEEIGVPPKVLMVDYLGYWSRAFSKKSKYEQVSEAIMELKRIAKQLDLIVIAPHQVSRMGRRGERLELDFARDSGVVEETSDFVLSLYKPGEIYDDEEDAGIDWRKRADTRLEVLKSRHGGVGHTSLLYWAPYSLSLIERNSWLEQKVQDEWYAEAVGLLYEEVLKNHKRGFMLT